MSNLPLLYAFTRYEGVYLFEQVIHGSRNYIFNHFDGEDTY